MLISGTVPGEVRERGACGEMVLGARGTALTAPSALQELSEPKGLG